MENVIGTLVKQDDAGRYSPYLASSWSSSEDHKTWSFKFRPGLNDESGEPMTAAGYVEGLKVTLKYLKKHKGELPVLDNLVGLQNFIENKSPTLSGLVHQEDQVIFTFSSPIRSGFLEFLAMPYFGYHSLRNYQNGTWKTANQVVSSGAYTLEKFGLDKVILKKRSDWFSHLRQSPDLVEITQEEFSTLSQYQDSTLLMGQMNKDIQVNSDYKSLKGIPEILISVVLSPALPPFDKVQNRQIFLELFRSLQKERKITDPFIEIDSSFYTQFPREEGNPHQDPQHIEPIKFQNIEASHKIKVLLTDHTSHEHEAYIRDLITQVMKRFEIEVEFEKLSRAEKDWLQRATSMTEFPIKVLGVSAGTGFLNWATEMMFCSKLGISFPDPSKRICDLVTKENHEPMDPEQYEKQFNTILREDAAVIPLFHKGFSWYYSKNLKLAQAPVAAPPRFDLIELE
jgi:ABC-type transport system substrate-binding protein